MPTSAREKLQISDTSDCIGKVLKSPTKKRPRFSGGAFYDRVCKPGSVIDSHLSRRTVAGALQPPSRKQPGKPCFLCGVAPDRVYSNGRFHTPLGELLPRLSILTSSAQTSYPSPRRKRQVSVIPLRRLPPQNIRFAGHPFLGLRRFISVALFLRSLWAGVTRYPCPAEPGLSSCAAFRRCARDCPTRSRMYCTLFAGKSQTDCNFFPMRI